MTDLICRNTMTRCQTPGTCSPHGGCRPSTSAPVQVISVEAPGLSVEKDLFGTVHIKLNYEGGEPFDFVQIRYDHRFTSNSNQHYLAQRIVAAISGVDPDRDQLKAENEALRKDAERYRWLRDKSEAVHSFYLSVPIWFSKIRFRKEDVDGGIDGAMAQEAKL